MIKDFIKAKPNKQTQKQTAQNKNEVKDINQLDYIVGEKKFDNSEFPDFTQSIGKAKFNDKNSKQQQSNTRTVKQEECQQINVIQKENEEQEFSNSKNDQEITIHKETIIEVVKPVSKSLKKDLNKNKQIQPVSLNEVLPQPKEFDDQEFPDLSKPTNNNKPKNNIVQAQVKPIINQKNIASHKQSYEAEQLLNDQESPLQNNQNFPDLLQSISVQSSKKSLSRNAQKFTQNLVLSQPSNLNATDYKQRQLLSHKEQIEEDFQGLIVKSQYQSNQNELTFQIKPKENVKAQVFRVEDEEEDQFDEETTIKLFNVIDNIKHNKQGKLYFDDQNMAYLFALLLNETRTQMTHMKDYFNDETDYLDHILPLFINESLCQVKMQCEEYEQRYGSENSALPLRFKLQIDPEKTLLGKYLVLQGTEDDYDQAEDGNTWKKWFFSEYQDFKESTSFVVQILVQQEIQKNAVKYSSEFQNLIGIVKMQKQKNDILKSYWIYLPWNKRVINAFKIPNIKVVDSEFYDYGASSMHKELKKTYQELPYANLQELYPHQFLTHINPIMKPATYLIEITALMNAHKSPFFQLILQPSSMNPTPVSIEASNFGQDLLKTLKQFYDNQKISELYNDSQRRAIIDACNYKKPITIINGPPGTGKTFTSLGIMSAVLEHMRNRGEKGIILACAHSNTVINDWVRKISRASEYVKTQDFDGVPVNTIINSKGEPQKVKVLRIGISDKCDPDIYDYALDIIAQRIFFDDNLEKSKKSDLDALFPNQIPKNKCYSLIHVKKRIVRINELMQELDLKIYIFRATFEGSQALVQKSQIKAEKSMLKTLYQSMSKLLTLHMTSYRSLLQTLISGAQIIVSTLTSSVSKILKDLTAQQHLPIQLLIIDEAPQCYEPSILIPLATYEVRKLVLIGDHRQLGPLVHDQTNSVNFQYSRSLYERLIIKLPFFMLDIQYRSLPNLSAFTSQMFYNNTVKDAVSVCNQEFPMYLQGTKLFSTRLGLLKKTKNFLFFDLFQSQQAVTVKKSYQNEAEAWAVTFLVTYLIQRLKQHSEPQISVISPYKAQVQLIKKYLVQETKDEDIFSQVEVSTVDSFQGKENDIMIISLVRSEGVGFLKDPRRANVATSRAQYAQYIFGSRQALVNDVLWRDIFVYLSDRNAVIDYDFNEIKKKQKLFELILNT